jgi:integrase
MKRPKPRTVGGTAPIEALGRATLTKLKNVLSLAVSHAVSQDVARFNAVKDAKISAEASPKKTKGEIPLKELERLLPVLRDDPNGAPFYLMVRTGLSYQEAFALSVDAYDGEELKVFQAVKRDKAPTTTPEVDGEKSPQKLEVSSKMKNKYRRRNLGPQSDVVEVLNRHLAQESKRIEATRTAGETPLMFAQANGAPINNKTANKVLRAFCESLGIEARHEDDNGRVMFGPVTTHVLRHTYINRQLEKKDVSDLDVVEIVGHSDTRMIYSVYKKHDSQKVRNA